MSLSTLKDRVRAATEQPATEATVGTLAKDAKPSTPNELHTSAQGEDGAVADIALNWLERYGNEFTRALPSHIDTGAFLAAVRAALPGLVRCTPASLLQALLTCARFGLIPDGRHAVIKAEGRTAVFVPMAQGYVDLMYRSGRVRSVHVGMIHAGDEWNYEPTAPAPLDFTHKPALTVSKKERGEEILAYAFCWMESGARSQVVILTREDAEGIRDEYSQAYQRAQEAGTNDSFWHTDFPAMWKKSAVRRLHKVVPMSAEMVRLLDADDAGETGTPQILHTPDPEAAGLVAEAERAAEAAEACQEEAPPMALPLPRKRSIRRSSGKPRRRNRDNKGRRQGA